MIELPSIETLDDVRALARDLPGPDDTAAKAAVAREARLTKPEGALGRLEALTRWLAAWQGRHPPRVERVRCALFAGNHGVAERQVSAYPPEVTRQMVDNFLAGGAAINQICLAFDISLKVNELALDLPTRDFTREPAMTEAECIEAIVFGMEALESRTDLLCVGEMGIGNTTVAAALCHALIGGAAAVWTGRGTGVDDETLGRKTAVVAEGVLLHAPFITDGLEALRRVGGREQAAMVGAVLAARLNRIPVLLDGYVAGASAAVLQTLSPGALDHCQAAHVSAEPGHRVLLEAIDLAPLLDLDLRLGEGSGAALAVPLLRAAAACHRDMATFEEAGVSHRTDR